MQLTGRVANNQSCLCLACPLPLPAPASTLVPEPFLPPHPPLPQPSMPACLQTTGVQDPAARGCQRLAQRRVARERQGARLGLGMLNPGQGCLWAGWGREHHCLRGQRAGWLAEGSSAAQRQQFSSPVHGRPCTAGICRFPLLLPASLHLPPTLRFSPADAAWWHKGRHWRFAWRTHTREGPALQPAFQDAACCSDSSTTCQAAWLAQCCTDSHQPTHAPTTRAAASCLVWRPCRRARRTSLWSRQLTPRATLCCAWRWVLAAPLSGCCLVVLRPRGGRLLLCSVVLALLCCAWRWVLAAVLGCPCLVMLRRGWVPVGLLCWELLLLCCCARVPAGCLAARWQITARPAHAGA